MTDGAQRIGWNVFELGDFNSTRNCHDPDCDRDGRFYVHEFGFACGNHLPNGASPPE